MERWRDRVAVVTGMGAGIGAAIARELVRAGVVVVGLAPEKRQVEEVRATLPAAQQLLMHAVACVVGDANSVNAAFDWIEQTLGGVDILVNNAGVLSQRQLLTHDIAVLHDTLQTGVMGVVHCTQRAFRSMKARNFAGHVVVINSCLGPNVAGVGSSGSGGSSGGGNAAAPLGALPVLNIYAPSKFAINAITEVLRQEFRGFKTQIKITSITAGTPCGTGTGTGTGTGGGARRPLRQLPMLKPEDIAGGVLHALSMPAHHQLHELTIRPIAEVF